MTELPNIRAPGRILRHHIGMRYPGLVVAISLFLSPALLQAQRSGGALGGHPPTGGGVRGGPSGHLPNTGGSKPGAPSGSFSRHGRPHHHNGRGTIWLPSYTPYWDYWDSPFWEYSDYAPEDMGQEPPEQEMLNGPAPSVPLRENSQPQSGVPSPAPQSPKLIEVPQSGKTVPTKQQSPALFVLVDGQRIESHHYVVTANSLKVDVDRRQLTIPLSAVDLDATVAANQERGIALIIPRDGNSLFVSF